MKFKNFSNTDMENWKIEKLKVLYFGEKMKIEKWRNVIFWKNGNPYGLLE